MKKILRIFLPLWSSVYKYWRNNILKFSHQRLDMVRTMKKWELMKPFFNTKSGSLLDIGCNEGVFSLEAAKLGWTVKGVDLNENAVSYARKAALSAGMEDSVSYDVDKITLEYLHPLQKFDGVLMLSMFQEIFSALGHDTSMAIFGETLDHCNDFMLFETATTRAKYSNSSKVFDQDNDETSITKWVESLAEIRPGWKVRLMGRTEYTTLEPYRLMYLFERTGR